MRRLRSAPSPFRRSGFTLLEIILVVAIIAVLAFLLLPVFGTARENARRARCQGNLRQIGLAVQQYAHDYDQTLPPMYTGTSADPRGPKWCDLIYPYARSEQIFVCPSDTTNLPFVLATNGRTNYAYGSYGVNQAYGGTPGDNTTPPFGRSEAAITVPATTVWAADVQIAGGNADFYWDDMHLPFINGMMMPRVLANGGADDQGIVERHLDTTNVLFLDGHVKGLRLDALTQHNKATPPIMLLFTIEDD